MTAELRWLWSRLNANYWFYPALFSLIGVLLALALVYLDRSGLMSWLNHVAWLVPARPNSASNMLQVIATSMIGIASTVFSITIAAVVYASGTYGPRLLTNFMEDRGNQLSLAVFIGTFVYAVTVLRTVRAVNESPTSASDAAATALAGFVPQLSLLVAYILMGISVAVLVYFLNHIPSGIRINTVLKDIGKRLIKSIEETYPDPANGEGPIDRPRGGAPLMVEDAGYVTFIDFDELTEIADERECKIVLQVRTGDFVHGGMTLAELCDAEPSDELAGAIRECFTLGSSRTPEQDPQFLIDELVEIGLRALSPGINDPFTAITAMHWLGAATAKIGQRMLHKDICGERRPDCPVIPLGEDFGHYVARGFGSYAGGGGHQHDRYAGDARGAAQYRGAAWRPGAADIAAERRHGAGRAGPHRVQGARPYGTRPAVRELPRDLLGPLYETGERLMQMRSWLFVPGDSERKLAKVADAGADVVIVDLEDAVAPEAKAQARSMTAEWLGAAASQTGPARWVRINPLDGPLWREDLAAVMAGAGAQGLGGIMVPKANGPAQLATLATELGALEARHGVPGGATRILPLVSETPAAALGIRDYGSAQVPRLAGLTWGAEDLSAAIGASRKRGPDGGWTDLFRMVRSTVLLAAHAAGVAPIDTLFADFADLAGLERAAQASSADGFAGMLAIHPAQVPVINAAFSPSEAELAEARRIVALFEDAAGAGALQLDGRMVDRPHLEQAKRLLARTD